MTIARHKQCLFGILTAWAFWCAQPVLAGEIWPAQPVHEPPVLREHNMPDWPGDLRAERERHGGELAFWATNGIWFMHPTVLPGGLVQSTGPGLFFLKRSDLDLYLGPLRALGPNVRILPARRPLSALERIDARSAGGHAVDDLLGAGFVLWPPDSDNRFPDWTELLIGERRYTDYAFRPPYQQRFGCAPGWLCSRKILIRHARNASCGFIRLPDKGGFTDYRMNPHHYPHCNDP